MAKSTKSAKASSPNPDLRTTTKKSLDSMSEAHRRHIERWEPFLARLGAEHVWAATPRDLGRNGSRFYLAIKVGAKNYSIVEFDSSAKAAESTSVLVADIASPKTVLAEFRAYREMAKAERDAAREAAKSTDSPKADPKPTPKKKVVRKTKSA